MGYEGWSVVLDRNLLVGPGGAKLRLPPTQAEILFVLVEKQGRTASVESIISAVWKWDPPDSARNSVHVHLYKMRKRLPPALVIHSVPARGYWLEIKPDVGPVSVS